MEVTEYSETEIKGPGQTSIRFEEAQRVYGFDLTLEFSSAQHGRHSSGLFAMDNTEKGQPLLEDKQGWILTGINAK